MLPDGNFDRYRVGYTTRLPDGQISPPADFFPVKPRLGKYFGFSEMQIRLYDSLSRPTEGRIRIVRDAGRDAVDAAASGVKRDGRAGSQGFVSDQTTR